MKKSGSIVVSLLLTIVIGWIIYRGVPNWGEAGRVMLRGKPLWFLVALFFIALHMVLRAQRWGILLSPTKKRISQRNLLSLTLVKYVVNVIPPRVGEIAGSILLARKENIPAASVIAASVFERVLDTLIVAVLFGVYLLAFSHMYLPDSETGKAILLAVRRNSLLIFMILLLGIGALIVLLRSRWWHSWVPRPARRLVHSFMDGFRALHSGPAVLQVLFLSLAIWLVITVEMWSLVRAYLDGFPFPGTLLLMAMTVVGVSIPTPGGVGGFQFFMDITLVNFFPAYLSAADPQSQAAGISNGSYIVAMVPIIVVGLILLYREGLSISSLSRLSALAPESTDG